MDENLKNQLLMAGVSKHEATIIDCSVSSYMKNSENLGIESHVSKSPHDFLDTVKQIGFVIKMGINSFERRKVVDLTLYTHQIDDLIDNDKEITKSFPTNNIDFNNLSTKAYNLAEMIWRISPNKELADQTLTQLIYGGLIANGDVEKVKIDKLDVNILEKLNENARQPLATIARSCDVKIDTIKNRIRIQKLIEENVILSFNPLIVLNKIGISATILLIKKKSNAKNLFEFESFLKEYMPYPLKTIGAWDYVVFMGAENQDKLYQQIRDMRNAFPDTISTISTVSVLEDSKFTFFPHGVAEELRGEG